MLSVELCVLSTFQLVKVQPNITSRRGVSVFQGYQVASFLGDNLLLFSLKMNVK